MTPTRLNQAIGGLTISMAASKLLGTADAGAAIEIGYTAAGLALLQGADAAAQRNALGVLGSYLENAITGNIQTGTISQDMIYTTGPVLSLTAGTWLVFGSATMRTTNVNGEFWLGFRNINDNVDFGRGCTVKNESLAVLYPVHCMGVVSVVGTKDIRLKGFRTGAVILEMGSVNGFSGSICAVRLTT